MIFNKILFSFLILSTNLNINAKNCTLKVGISPDYPPFESIEKGQLIGFDVDLAKIIGKELNCNIEFIQIPFSSLMASLNANKIDVIISGMEFDEKRLKNVDFSDCYLEPKNSLTLLFKKGSMNNQVDLNNLFGIYSVQLGSVQENFLLKLKNKKFKILSIENNNTIIQSILSKKIDGGFFELDQAKKFSKNNPKLSYIEFNNNGSTCSVVGIKKGNFKLKEEINITIRKLKQSKEIDNLKNKHFNYE